MRRIVLLLVFASAAAWSQSQPASDSNSDTSKPQGSDNTPVTSATLPDSTKLEAIKTKKPDYPLQASQEGIQGQVMMELHISETGEVESVEVLSGDQILAKAAVKAAKQWQFKPFVKNGKPVKVVTKMPFDFFFRDRAEDTKAPADSASTNPDANDGSSTAPAKLNLPQRVRVSQGVSEGLLMHKVTPVYPMEAKQRHIEGHVLLRAVIGKDGRIQDLRPITGPKELIPAAMGAVQQWRYRPYKLFGEPVEVDTAIDINFVLSH